VAAGAVVLGLVSLLAVLDGGGTDTSARSTPTTTSSSSSTTASTTRVPVVTAAPTTSTASTLPPLLLGEPSGVELLVQADRGALIVDLDTGEIRRPDVNLDGFAVARTGGIVLSGPDDRPGATFLAAPYDGTPVPIAPSPVGQVFPSAVEDRVWMVSASGPPFQVFEVAVGREVTTPAFELPGDGYVAGAVDGGVVVAAHGSIFVDRGTDDVTPLGAGEVVATLGRSIAAMACDDAARCSLTIIDARSGRRRAIDVSGGYGQAAFSPDGRRLAFLAGTGMAPPRLMLVDIEARTARDANLPTDNFNGALPVFSADGRWLFSINGTAIEALRLDDDSVVEIPLGLRAQQINQVVVLP
jgi:hypothetical protein